MSRAALAALAAKWAAMSADARLEIFAARDELDAQGRLGAVPSQAP